MSETQPMPLPWTLCVLDLEGPCEGKKPYRRRALQHQIRALALPSTSNIVTCWSGGDKVGEANGKFIIRAVNCHDDLVAALASCQDLIERWMNGPVMQNAGITWEDAAKHPTALIHARAILAKVKEAKEPEADEE